VPSTSYTGANFEVAGDVDWFQFTAEAGHIYEFQCSSSTINCNAYLTDAAGTIIASDTSSSSSARLRWEFNTGGTYYLRVVAVDWFTSTGYSYRVQDLGVDDHGNTLATATPIVPSTSYTGANFEVSGDVDWFQFTAEAGHIYEFQCSSSTINCNAYLTDAAGTIIVSDTSSSSSARVRWEFTTGGTYYLRAVAADWFTSTGYSYRLQDLGVDDHGDTLATATPIVPSTSYTGADFEVAGDVDWFQFTAEAGHIYEFQCSSSTINCNAYLTDAAGTIIASDTSSSSSARLRWEFNTGGTFYLRVVAVDWFTATGYSYRVQDLGVDDHGDTLATATPIVPSINYTAANFEVSGDVDWFQFTAEAGHIYEFQCSSSTINCNVYMTDAAGTTIVSDTGSSSSARVRWEFTTGGTFYLRVVAADWFTATGYSYRLQDLGLDDHGDTLATATPIVPSVSFTGADFEVSGDVDWFQFTAEAGHIYEFNCSSSSINCNAYLTDAAGTTIVSDTSNSSSARVRWELNTEGTYYLRVVAVDWFTSTGYSYQLMDLGVDDHSDTFTGATVLMLGTAAGGNIETGGDADFFAVSLTASTSYTVTTTGLSNTITVYAPDGTTVLSTGASPRSFTSTAAGGTHYVRVLSSSATATGSYTVRVQ
jgi:hypothetical protein